MAITKINKISAYLNTFFWLFTTYLLAPYFYVSILLAKKNKNPLKILVIQIGKIGDLVCTTPIFREIKKRYPSAHLTTLVLSKTEGVLKNNPRIDEIIFITNYVGTSGKLRLLNMLRKEKYDWAINFLPDSFGDIISFWSLIPHRITTTYRYSGEIVRLISIFNNYRLEYKRHTPLSKHYLNLLGFLDIKDPSGEKEVFIRPAEEEKASEFLRAKNLSTDDLLIGISATAGIKMKEWEPQKFAVLADRLIEEKNAKIIFIGSADDRILVEGVQKMMHNNSVNACGLFGLSEVPALLKRLKLFISVDTGPLYIADAVGVPVVDILGPVDAGEIYSLGKRSVIVQKKIYCAPCAHMFYVPRFCKEGHLRCFKEITPEEVFEAASFLINKQQ
mgnify:CR=1 FL=1